MLAIVDDDQSVRESIEGLLDSVGYDVVAFASPRELLDAVGRATFDCLILDVQMPGMTGPDVQRHLNASGVRIPIVFITSDTDPALRARVLAAGAISILYKPFADDALLHALETALASR